MTEHEWNKVAEARTALQHKLLPAASGRHVAAERAMKEAAAEIAIYTAAIAALDEQMRSRKAA